MFLQQITTDQGINTKGFWEFREKYAPGNFSFSSGVEHLGTQVIQELPESGTPLHTFTSEYLISRDFVVPINAQINRAEQARQFLSERVSLPAQENILYADETNLLFKTLEGEHIIFFYRPIEELYQADGLFDFTDEERALLRDTFWVNITEIK